MTKENKWNEKNKQNTRLHTHHDCTIFARTENM